MLDKKECEKATTTINEYAFDVINKRQVNHFEVADAVELINKLIKEYFEPKENTLDFKYFKLHSDSTLKSLTKDELISYIHILHHNWQATDERYFNVMEYARKLQQQRKWISVEDRLPEDNTDYLITDGEDIMVGFYRNDAQAWDNGNFGWVEREKDDDGMMCRLNNIIAWMPLPELHNGE